MTNRMVATLAIGAVLCSSTVQARHAGHVTKKIRPGRGQAKQPKRVHEEDLLDDALDQTFPASDPAPPPRFD